MSKTTTNESDGFLIVSPGDHRVGIFKSEWELKGDFHFASFEDKLKFMELIRQAFELVADDSIVYDIDDAEIQDVIPE